MIEQTEPAGIRLQGVSAVMQDRNRGEIVAVRNVDLDVEPGELLTLLGPSRLRQDHDLAHDRRLSGAERRQHFSSPGATSPHVPANAARYRLCVPELRAVSASDHLRQRRLRP